MHISETAMLPDKSVETVTIAQILQKVVNGESIQEVINASAQMMGNALIYMDMNYRIIAHSTNYEIVDPNWAENVERGYCSYDFLQRARRIPLIRALKRGDNAVCCNFLEDKQLKLATRIIWKGHTVGHLIMIVHHSQLSDISYPLISQLGWLIYALCNHEIIVGGHEFLSPNGRILYELLDEVNPAEALDYAKESKLTFPPEMQVVVCRFNHRDQCNLIKQTLGLELKNIFPKGVLFQFKSYIVILVSDISKKQKNALIELAPKEEISIGISWLFDDLADFKRHFNQAVTSIKLAEYFGHTSEIFDYTNYFYYDLLNNYIDKISLKHFVHPTLNILKDYDIANKTSLHETLKAYLEYERKPLLVAKVLDIHKNTLLYRISRIKELTGLDLEDINMLRFLKYSFEIDGFLNLAK